MSLLGVLYNLSQSGLGGGRIGKTGGMELGKQKMCHPRDRTAIDSTLSVLVTGRGIKANHLRFLFFFFFLQITYTS